MANVRDSDATLILSWGPPTGGTAYTITCAEQLQRPHLVIDMQGRTDADEARRFLEKTQVTTLNIAGPRESTFPGAYVAALRLITEILTVPAR